MKAKLEQEYIVRSAKRVRRKKKNTPEETRPRRRWVSNYGVRCMGGADWVCLGVYR